MLSEESQHTIARREYKLERAAKLERALRVALEAACCELNLSGPKISPGETMFCMAMLASSVSDCVLHDEEKDWFKSRVKVKLDSIESSMSQFSRHQLLYDFCCVTAATAVGMLEHELRE